MEINFMGKDDVRSKALEDMIEKKLTKLDRFVKDNSTYDIMFSMESGDFVLSIQLLNDGDKYMAKAKGEDMYKNIDECISKLTTQLKKTKDIKRNRK